MRENRAIYPSNNAMKDLTYVTSGLTKTLPASFESHMSLTYAICLFIIYID